MELVTHEKQESRETNCKALGEGQGHEKVVTESKQMYAKYYTR